MRIYFPAKLVIATLPNCPTIRGIERQTHTAAAPANCHSAFGQPMNYAAPPSQPHESVNPSTLSALDSQPYGCIKLDKTGRVLELNVAASALLGVRRADAVNKCFFTDVAPCADIPAFRGLVKTAMADNGALNRVLEHRFLVSHLPDAMAAISVRVHLFSSTDAAGQPVVWIVTRKKIDAPPGSLATNPPERPRRLRVDAAAPARPALRPPIQSVSSDFDMSI